MGDEGPAVTTPRADQATGGRRGAPPRHGRQGKWADFARCTPALSASTPAGLPTRVATCGMRLVASGASQDTVAIVIFIAGLKPLAWSLLSAICLASLDRPRQEKGSEQECGGRLRCPAGWGSGRGASARSARQSPGCAGGVVLQGPRFHCQS
ncbi:hypothetical protein GQ53DRAFT_227949 [Thozetella sp. PMI_491]|nr:hypothetical protein GQ53DRAFT_227949 [Thozetella sp. PMI_491]